MLIGFSGSDWESPPTKKIMLQPTWDGVGGLGHTADAKESMSLGTLMCPIQSEGNSRRVLTHLEDGKIDNVFSPCHTVFEKGVPMTMGNSWQCLVLKQTLDVFPQRNVGFVFLAASSWTPLNWWQEGPQLFWRTSDVFMCFRTISDFRMIYNEINVDNIATLKRRKDWQLPMAVTVSVAHPKYVNPQSFPGRCPLELKRWWPAFVMKNNVQLQTTDNTGQSATSCITNQKTHLSAYPSQHTVASQVLKGLGLWGYSSAMAKRQLFYTFCFFWVVMPVVTHVMPIIITS